MSEPSQSSAAEPRLEDLVVQANAGDRAALEEVVRRIQERVYNLALRMLWHPEDAEDAAQEILVRIITHLGGFRGESAFSTWVYRVACNYLLTTRKRRMESPELNFERFGEDLDQGLSEAAGAPANTEKTLLLEEVKIGCTHGMLLCLDRQHRLSFILGEVFELTDREAAEVLAISAAAFRKRLSRARQRLYDFMRTRCGLVNSSARCRCERRVDRAIEMGRVNPGYLLFAGHAAIPGHDAALMQRVKEMEDLHEAAAIFRSHPQYAAAPALLEGVKRLVDSGKFKILSS